jgi:hypothetical protein
MPEPLEIGLNQAQRRLLQIMAEQGVVGSTEEEVVEYMVMRHFDDMMRVGVLKLGSEA